MQVAKCDYIQRLRVPFTHFLSLSRSCDSFSPQILHLYQGAKLLSLSPSCSLVTCRGRETHNPIWSDKGCKKPGQVVWVMSEETGRAGGTEMRTISDQRARAAEWKGASQWNLKSLGSKKSCSWKHWIFHLFFSKKPERWQEIPVQSRQKEKSGNREP